MCRTVVTLGLEPPNGDFLQFLNVPTSVKNRTNGVKPQPTLGLEPPNRHFMHFLHF